MHPTMERALSHGKVVAHRGCWNLLHPENSWTALKRAADNGCAIELDVHLMKDGNIAVFHDFTLNRMCLRGGKLEELTRDDVKDCKLRLSKERIPFFDDVLKMVDGRVPIYVELKCDGNEIKLADALIKMTEGYNGDLIFIGFHPKAGAYLKEKGYAVGYSCFAPPAKLPYEADCIIGHLFGVPWSKKKRESYPPFIPWTVYGYIGKIWAKCLSKQAIYNTHLFVEYWKYYKQRRGKK